MKWNGIFTNCAAGCASSVNYLNNLLEEGGLYYCDYHNEYEKTFFKGLRKPLDIQLLLSTSAAQQQILGIRVVRVPHF